MTIFFKLVVWVLVVCCVFRFKFLRVMSYTLSDAGEAAAA